MVSLSFYKVRVMEMYRFYSISDKRDMVTNIELESVVPSFKKYFFYPHMVHFFNKKS